MSFLALLCCYNSVYSLEIDLDRILEPGCQNWFQWDIRSSTQGLEMLYRPLKFFHHKLRKQLLHRPSFVHGGLCLPNTNSSNLFKISVYCRIKIVLNWPDPNHDILSQTKSTQKHVQRCPYINSFCHIQFIAYHSLTFRVSQDKICFLNQIYLIILKYFSVKLISCLNDPKPAKNIYF